MKKILALVLAVMMTVAMTSVGFAATSSDMEDFNGRIYVEEENLELSPGTTYDVPLMNERSSGNSWEVDTDYMDDFTLKMKVVDGKSYASAKVTKVDDEYVLRITTKEYSGKNDREFVVSFTAKEKKSPRRTWESDEIVFTILSDRSNVSDTVTENRDEITVNSGERVTIELEDDVYSATVWFDDVAYVELRGFDNKYYTFDLREGDSVGSVFRVAPDDAELSFYNFKVATGFETPTTVGLLADNDEGYLYQIDINGGLKAINAKSVDGYLVFKTTKLGHYVLSTHRLGDTGTVAPEENTEDYEDVSKVETSYGGILTKSDIEEVYKVAPVGGTAVLFVEDNSTVKLEDLKAVQAAYPNRALCVVNRVFGKTQYQYRMTASQAALITDADGDGYVALGMSKNDANTTAVFNKYYKNKVYVVGHENVKSLGTNGYFAVDMSSADLNTSNLKFYWYDSARNYYMPIQTTYKIDQYNYIYFTAPVGYDVVISEGALAQA